MATADRMERDRQQRGGRGTAINTVGQPGGARPGTTTRPVRGPGMTADDYISSGRVAGGSYVGGPDRRTSNGGAVVDGVYIPPGTQFGPSPTRASGGGSSTATTTPSGGGGGGGSGGSGGGGGGGGQRETGSNVDQTSQLYADALKALLAQYETSQANIMGAIARMESDPYNKANAYAAMQILAPTVAADPMAEYMAAAGMSGGQSAAAEDLAQAQTDAYTRAMQNVKNVMSTSQQQANASRMADIGLVRTGATQDLESNLNMLRLGLEKERLGAVTGLQQRNLENEIAIRNALTSSIGNIFAGQNVAPESILKLIESALAKLNMRNWTTLPLPGA